MKTEKTDKPTSSEKDGKYDRAKLFTDLGGATGATSVSLPDIRLVPGSKTTGSLTLRYAPHPTLPDEGESTRK